MRFSALNKGIKLVVIFNNESSSLNFWYSC